ncbi:MAG: hypothetical protein HY981_00550 [Candidatus Magasanikbacteria bacterium]|nr:hypothetical protein [Candidatus Magasanikbacteria bacterium]
MTTADFSNFNFEQLPTQPLQNSADLQFGIEIFTRGKNFELFDDTERIAMIRAVMDAAPVLAADIFNTIADKEHAIIEMIEWIRRLEGDYLAKLHKMQGLIDFLSLNGQLGLFIKEIVKVRADSLEKTGENNTLLDLTTDPERLSTLLVAATKDDNLIKALLRVQGKIVRTNPQSDTYDVNIVLSFYTHGLLRAAGYFGNSESLELILNAADQASMIPEMFLDESLIYTFWQSASYGDISSLKKIIELVRKTESQNQDVALPSRDGDKICSFRDAVEAYKTRCSLPEDVGALEILLIGNRSPSGSSDLARAVESGNMETILFFLELLSADEKLFAVLGKILYEDIKAFVTLEYSYRDSNPDTEIDKILSSPEVFLKTLAEASKNRRLLEEFLIKLFSGAERQPRPRPLSTHVEKVTNLPIQYSQECYKQLVLIMNFFDQMNQASGKAKEWARKLTIMFNDVELAKQYVESAIQWAIKKSGDSAVWKHRTHRSIMNWPEEIAKGLPGSILETSAIDVVMGFDFPLGAFDSTPWRKILKTNPEAAYYISLAPEIEKYITKNRKDFPQTIEDLRDIVLELNILQCGFSYEIAQELRHELQLSEIVTQTAGTRKFRSGVVIPGVSLPPIAQECIRRLSIMGVLKGVTANGNTKKSYPVVTEEESPRFANRDETKGVVDWPMECYQIFMDKNDTPNGLNVFEQILINVKALQTKTRFEFEIDTKEINESKRVEFIKQLCVAVVRLVQDRDLDKSPASGSSPRKPNAEKLLDEVVIGILNASSESEVIKIYSKYFPTISTFMRFKYDYNILFSTTVPKFTGDVIQNTFEQVHEFINMCLQLLDQNNGKARDADISTNEWNAFKQLSQDDKTK